VSKVEGEIGDKLTESGLTPTKDETSCIVEGLEPLVSESEALSDKSPTSQQNQEIEKITTGCLGEATATGSTEDPLAGLQACEEDPESSDCIQEATERGLSKNYGAEEEEVRSEAEGEESENQGLQEMDQELQQEYEEEGHTP
jgi:hypothetical protein